MVDKVLVYSGYVVVWISKDIEILLVLSAISVVERRVRGHNGRVISTAPESFVDYNNGMGGNDDIGDLGGDHLVKKLHL